MNNPFLISMVLNTRQREFKAHPEMCRLVGPEVYPLDNGCPKAPTLLWGDAVPEKT